MAGKNGFPDEDMMLSHYTDPRINGYANLDYHQQPGYRNAERLNAAAGDPIRALISESLSASYDLHVSNVPAKLDQNGIRNLFGRHGRVLKVDMPRSSPVAGHNDKTWARVTFATLEEAQSVMMNVHRKPPFHMHVEFAISPEERERRRNRDREMQQAAEEVIARQAHFERTKGLTADMSAVRLSFRSQQQMIAAETHPSGAGDRSGSNRHHRVDVSGFSSGLEDEWTPARARGSSPRQAEQPAARPDPDMSTFVFGHPMVLPYAIPGKCESCHRDSRVRCSRCKSWYCSQVCQIRDWPRHRPNCIPPPPLENIDGTPFYPTGQKLRQPAANLYPDEMKRQFGGQTSKCDKILGEKSGEVKEETFSASKVDKSVQISGEKVTAEVSSTKKRQDPAEVDQVSSASPPSLNVSNAKPVENPSSGPELTRKTDEKSGNSAPLAVSKPEATSSPQSQIEKAEASAKPEVEVEIATQKSRENAEKPAAETDKLIRENTCQPSSRQDEDEKDRISIELAGSKPAAKSSPQSKIKKAEPLAKPEVQVGIVKEKSHKNAEKPTPESDKLVRNTTSDHSSGQDEVGSKMEKEDPSASVSLADPDESSKLANKRYESVLQGLKKGDEIRCVTEFDSQSPVKFNASVFNTDAVDRFFVEMGRETPENAAKDASPGKLCISFSDDFDSYVRSFILKAEGGTFTVLDVDSMSVFDVDKVYEIPDKRCGFPFLGIKAICQGVVSESLDHLIREILSKAKGVFTFKVVDVNLMQDDIVRSVECVMMDNGGKELVNYVLYPWSFASTSIHDLAGVAIASPVVLLRDLDTKGLVVGDTVVKNDFGASADSIIISRMADLDHESGLAEALALEVPKMPQVPADQAVKGRIFACKWSEDDSYYRCLVTQVVDNRVKVRFIDYGNVSVESLDSLRYLPDRTLKIPVLARQIFLAGVPDQPLSDAATANRLSQLQPLFAVSLTVTAVEVAENGGKRYTLGHANGKTVNDMVKSKLAEDLGAAIPLPMQGQEWGGRFVYDKVHVAMLAEVDGEQEVTITHAEAPGLIFACPNNQIGTAHSLATQIHEFCAINSTISPSHCPDIGTVCLAQSAEDEAWYRGTCIGVNDDAYSIFFIDFGFQETLPRTRLKCIDPILMETMALANHCVLEGFDSGRDSASDAETFGRIISEKLPFMHSTKLRVVRKGDGHFIVSIPELQTAIPHPPVAKEPEKEPETAKPDDCQDVEERKMKEQIQLLQEQLKKMAKKA